MTTYPNAIDAFPNPIASTGLAGHAALHTSVNAAILALQAKVGTNNSTDPESLTYRVNAVETMADPLAYYILSKA